MRAAVRKRYGAPDVVHLTEVEPPTPAADDLLVRVRATTVNRTDCGYRAGRPFIVRLFSGLRGPKVSILGNEFAGEIEAVGTRVSSFAVGDRVFGYNEGPFGAHAQYLTIPEHASVATMPANLTFEEAAPGTEGAHYALSFIRQAKVGGGDLVLVYGATGAIGSAAVQLLKAVGAEVTAVCATPHVALVEDLGADRVVDYLTEDFTEDPRRYRVVLDAVGKSSFGSCRRLLERRGVYLSTELGRLSQNPLLAITTPLLRGRKVLFPLPKHDQAMVRYLADLIESGRFTPIVDRTYPLEEIVEAYRYVESGQKIGNVVITLDPVR
jgi:NADPH:quinone reductase-like Zn-dependent oxidoreductase